MTDLVTSFADRGLEYAVTDEGVAWLRLNRPEKRNAIDRPLRTAIIEAVEEVTEDPDVRVAVITGNGRAFSSGADLTQEGGPIEIPPERRRVQGGREDGILYGWYRMVDRIWKSTKPFIAAVNGIAAGGGCQLALGCDIVLASEEAAFWEIFVRRGLPLEGGGAWLLTRSISLVRAKEMALYGEPIPARKAESWGLVNLVVPGDELEATAQEWAHKLATLAPPNSGPSAFAPGGAMAQNDLSVPIGNIKTQLNSAWEKSMYQTFMDEIGFLGGARRPADLPTGPPAGH
jgi:2-(1,2-epoxy-1,2-dihydrophenyl)acetyl-CoA isomerase